MSKGAIVSLLMVMGLTAPSVARAEVITLDAGPLHSTNYLSGQAGLGRGFGFLVDETFALSAIALDLSVGVADGTSYQYEVFASTNGHAADGGLLTSSAPFTLAAGTGYQDRSLAFTFNAGSFYVVNFSRVAEIGSRLLSAQTGIPHDPAQHAAYVAHWIRAWKEDKNEIFRAASAAHAATDYVLALDKSHGLADETSPLQKGPHARRAMASQEDRAILR